jgi:hypothetical protein
MTIFLCGLGFNFFILFEKQETHMEQNLIQRHSKKDFDCLELFYAYLAL